MDPLLVTDRAVPLRFLLGAVAGILATLSMDLVMTRLPEGDTPPFVASGVLTATRPRSAPGRLAAVVHYLAGGLIMTRVACYRSDRPQSGGRDGNCRHESL